MATDGKVVALIDGPEIVALDFRTGAEKWRAAFPLGRGRPDRRRNRSRKATCGSAP